MLFLNILVSSECLSGIQESSRFFKQVVLKSPTFVNTLVSSSFHFFSDSVGILQADNRVIHK